MADTAQELIGLVRSEIEQAADLMLSAAEKGLRDVAAARDGDHQALEAIQRTLCAILEACAFQDIAGQRLSRLASMLGGAPFGHPADPLLNGPAATGEGLDQDAADALMKARIP